MRVWTFESKLSDLSHAVRLLGHRTRRALTEYTLRVCTRYRQKQGKRSPHTLLHPNPSTITLRRPQKPGLGRSAWPLNLKVL